MSEEKKQHTVNVALNSAYAHHKADTNEYVFDMPDFNPRVVKASLGTLELPPVQSTVEAAWQRVGFDEGLTLCHDDDRILYLSGAEDIMIPMHRNRITAIEKHNTSLVITTEHPHCVITSDNRSVASCFDTGIGLVLTPSGLSLSAEVTLTYRSERCFKAEWADSESIRAAIVSQRNVQGASVQSAAISSARQAAAIIMAAADANSPFRTWPTSDGGAVLWQGADPDGNRGLGVALGMQQRKKEGTAYRGQYNPFGTYVNLPTGDYDMRRLLAVWPTCFAPVMPNRPAEGGGPRLYISDGLRMIGVMLASTSYTLEQLENSVNVAIAANANQADSIGGVVAQIPTLRFDANDGFLVISSTDNTLFGLNFDPPDSIEASIMGFHPGSYEGRATYTAQVRISHPRLHRAAPQAGPRGRAPRLLYNIKQHSARAITVSPQRSRSVLQNGLVQGTELLDLRPGDLVHLSTAGFVHVATAQVTMAPLRRGDGTAPGPPVPTHRITFEEQVAPSGIITVAPDASLSLHFADEGMRPSIMGFDKISYCPSPDRTAGALTGPVGLPSVVAPNDTALEHVPYVLLELGNGASHPTTLQRAVLEHGRTITVFAKVCFVPYRVERINPADVYYAEGECLGPVRLRILNPDGTPYCTHGATFTLSLALTTLEP